jgi:hypothetical protein
MSALDSIVFIRKKRPVAQPNCGFMYQLEALQILLAAIGLKNCTVVGDYIPSHLYWNDRRTDEVESTQSKDITDYIHVSS